MAAAPGSALWRRTPGLILRDGETAPQAVLEDLDGIGTPAEHLDADFLDDVGQLAYLSTSRGCPATCNFCNTPDFWGTSIRFRSPAAVLKEYGRPDEVWLQTARAPREGYLGFAIRLLYSEEGILIHYGGQGVLDKEDVVGCIPNAGGSLRLLAWNPELRLGYVDAMAIGMSTTIVTDDIDLESATGMTLGEFYDRFSTEGTELCLHTPQALWPGP